MVLNVQSLSKECSKILKGGMSCMDGQEIYYGLIYRRVR